MAALEPGTQAPDFTLPTMEGKQFSLSEALARGPVAGGIFQDFLSHLPVRFSFSAENL